MAVESIAYAAALIVLGVRWVYTHRLLPGVGYRDIMSPTLVPISIAAGAVVVLRLVLWGGQRTLLQALVELGLFVAIYSSMALHRERALLGELLGSVRGRGEPIVVGDEIAERVAVAGE